MGDVRARYMVSLPSVCIRESAHEDYVGNAAGKTTKADSSQRGPHHLTAPPLGIFKSLHRIRRSHRCHKTRAYPEQSFLYHC